MTEPNIRRSTESYQNRPNSSWRRTNTNITNEMANEEVRGINREFLLRSELGMRRGVTGKPRESRCSNKSSELRRNFKNFPLHYTYNVFLCSDEDDL